MAEMDLAADNPLQAQFVCDDWLPPWYFLHATGGHPGSICMRQAAKWQRRTLPLVARCKLNLYVTGCRLGTFCMRLAAAICLQLTQILNARGRVCKAAKKVGTLCSRQCSGSGPGIRYPVLFLLSMDLGSGMEKSRIRDPR